MSTVLLSVSPLIRRWQEIRKHAPVTRANRTCSGLLGGVDVLLDRYPPFSAAIEPRLFPIVRDEQFDEALLA